MLRRMDAYINNTPFSAERSMSLDAYRATAMVIPSKYIVGNTDDQHSSVKCPKGDRGVLIYNSDSYTVTPAFLLRVRRQFSLCLLYSDASHQFQRRKRSMAPDLVGLLDHSHSSDGLTRYVLFTVI